MPILSLLISVFANRTTQFKMSLESLTRFPFDKNTVELCVFIDYQDNDEIVRIVRAYRPYFGTVSLFRAKNKYRTITHSASRRNFLAAHALGECIVFSEPEMFHLHNTIQAFLRYTHPAYAHSWICGPVFGAKDMVAPNGELIVDSCTRIDNYRQLLRIPTRFKTTGNMFKRHYHKVDYTRYTAPFFCVMFHKKTFLHMKGLNQNLKVRGFEEYEFYSRFQKGNGRIHVDDDIQTIHLPHKRSMDKETQISWNLYNSTVSFDRNQKVGHLQDTRVEKIDIP